MDKTRTAGTGYYYRTCVHRREGPARARPAAAPAATVARAKAISWPLVGLAVALGVALAALVGLFIGRRNGRPRNAWPVSLGYSVAAAFMTVFVGGILVGRSGAVPASQAAWGYLPGFAETIAALASLVLALPLMAVVIFVLMQFVTSLVAGRMTSAARKPAQTA